jgi:hypothetical protein
VLARHHTHVALHDLSDRDAVLAAVEEFERLGQAAFLAKFGFGPAVRYWLEHDGRCYDSKAIAAAAHGYQFDRPLSRHELSGGIGPNGAARQLRELGFTIVDDRKGAIGSQGLKPGAVYRWTDLGQRFNFKPDYLAIAGGMISRPVHNALLLITHPRGARSFNYDDSWMGDDLVYTGRGKRGDQRYEGPNRDVGENAYPLHIFQPAHARALTYLGEARCINSWIELALDVNQEVRSVLRFQLRFRAAGSGLKAARLIDQTAHNRMAGSRAFDPTRAPTAPRTADAKHSPEETAQRHEKARTGHHAILVALHRRLRAAGWTELAEMPHAIDLWGRDPEGQRVIFEAKTVRDGTERARVRSALAQLLEYRFEFGDADDRLCLVTDTAVSVRATALLDSLGIAAVTCRGAELYSASLTARRLLRHALS